MSVFWWIVGAVVLAGIVALAVLRKPDGGQVSAGVADKAKDWGKK